MFAEADAAYQKANELQPGHCEVLYDWASLLHTEASKQEDGETLLLRAADVLEKALSIEMMRTDLVQTVVISLEQVDEHQVAQVLAAYLPPDWRQTSLTHAMFHFAENDDDELTEPLTDGVTSEDEMVNFSLGDEADSSPHTGTSAGDPNSGASTPTGRPGGFLPRRSSKLSLGFRTNVTPPSMATTSSGAKETVYITIASKDLPPQVLRSALLEAGNIVSLNYLTNLYRTHTGGHSTGSPKSNTVISVRYSTREEAEKALVLANSWKERFGLTVRGDAPRFLSGFRPRHQEKARSSHTLPFP